MDFNQAQARFEKYLKQVGLKIGKGEWKKIREFFTEKDESAEPVQAEKDFEPDTDLRDSERVPLKEKVADYFAREVLPYAPDAWVDDEKTDIGYEISFTKYFYKYQPLRPLEEIARDILALEAETEGLLHKIVDGSGKAQ
jgi:type I restriction enzyme M protein